MNILENEGKYIDQPGQYETTITAAEEGYNDNGDEVLKVMYSASNGTSIKANYTNNKSFGWKLARLCRACGLTDAQLLNFNAKMIIGKRVSIDVKINERDTRYCQVWDVSATESAPMPEAPSVAKDDVPF